MPSASRFIRPHVVSAFLIIAYWTLTSTHAPHTNVELPNDTPTPSPRPLLPINPALARRLAPRLTRAALASADIPPPDAPPRPPPPVPHWPPPVPTLPVPLQPDARADLPPDTHFLLPLRIAGSVLHADEALRDLAMLAQTLGRVLVLPGVGGGRVGACRRFDYGAYFADELGEGVGTVRMEDFVRWVGRREEVGGRVLEVRHGPPEAEEALVAEDGRVALYEALSRKDQEEGLGCIHAKMPHLRTDAFSRMMISVLREGRTGQSTHQRYREANAQLGGNETRGAVARMFKLAAGESELTAGGDASVQGGAQDTRLLDASNISPALDYLMDSLPQPIPSYGTTALANDDDNTLSFALHASHNKLAAQATTTADPPAPTVPLKLACSPLARPPCPKGDPPGGQLAALHASCHGAAEHSMRPGEYAPPCATRDAGAEHGAEDDGLIRERGGAMPTWGRPRASWNGAERALSDEVERAGAVPDGNAKASEDGEGQMLSQVSGEGLSDSGQLSAVVHASWNGVDEAAPRFALDNPLASWTEFPDARATSEEAKVDDRRELGGEQPALRASLNVLSAVTPQITSADWPRSARNPQHRDGLLSQIDQFGDILDDHGEQPTLRASCNSAGSLGTQHDPPEASGKTASSNRHAKNQLSAQARGGAMPLLFNPRAALASCNGANDRHHKSISESPASAGDPPRATTAPEEAELGERVGGEEPARCASWNVPGENALAYSAVARPDLAAPVSSLLTSDLLSSSLAKASQSDENAEQRAAEPSGGPDVLLVSWSLRVPLFPAAHADVTYAVSLRDTARRLSVLFHALTFVRWRVREGADVQSCAQALVRRLRDGGGEGAVWVAVDGPAAREVEEAVVNGGGGVGVVDLDRALVRLRERAEEEDDVEVLLRLEEVVFRDVGVREVLEVLVAGMAERFVVPGRACGKADDFSKEVKKLRQGAMSKGLSRAANVEVFG